MAFYTLGAPHPPTSHAPPQPITNLDWASTRMTMPPVGREGIAARDPLTPIVKLTSWLADLYAAPARAYERGYRDGYDAAMRECAGGGNAYPDRPRSVWEFRDLYKPAPEQFAALVQRYARGNVKRTLAEWRALYESIDAERPGPDG